MVDSKSLNAVPPILRANRVLDAYRLSWLANFFAGPIYKRLEDEMGLNRPEIVVLFCIAHVPEMTAMDICRATGRPKNSISRAIIALAGRRLIARTPDPVDQRAMRLSLTAAGKRAFDRLIPTFEKRETEMLSPLTSAERATLARLLEKLVLRTDSWAEPY